MSSALGKQQRAGIDFISEVPIGTDKGPKRREPATAQKNKKGDWQAILSLQ